MNQTRETGTDSGADPEQGRDAELQHVREALRGVQFGTVTIVVQDGVIVQIDRTEKRRIRRKPDVNSGKCSG